MYKVIFASENNYCVLNNYCKVKFSKHIIFIERRKIRSKLLIQRPGVRKNLSVIEKLN